MHLEEVLDWAGEALDRVDRASFFATFEQQHAVQYFYEPFLEAFDPELRKQLGVWYTPPEIVKYMVARVDQVLRSELDIADGLADPRVVVLDPCCGTGAYLVEVLNKIAETLHEKRGDALIANDLKKAAMSRVFGFEILPAPFVISHLQIGLALDRFGAPFAEDGKERAGVFLTNALTGWEPPTEPKQHLLFPELEMERDAAADVKQKKPILVILGNPPTTASPAWQSTRNVTWLRPTGGSTRLHRPKVRVERPLRALLPDGRAPRYRGQAGRGHRLLHHQLLVARRPLVHRHARRLLEGLRRHLDRLPERRQVQDRQADTRGRARSQRVLD